MKPAQQGESTYLSFKAQDINTDPNMFAIRSTEISRGDIKKSAGKRATVTTRDKMMPSKIEKII